MIKDLFRGLIQRLSAVFSGDHREECQGPGPSTYYGFSQNPFTGAADPRFLFLAQSHREALRSILAGIERGEEFLTLVGEPGSGKTFLIRHVIESLDKSIKTVFFSSPAQLSFKDEIRKLTADPEACRDQVGVSPDGEEKFHKPAVFFIDEAQNLTPEILEKIQNVSEKPGGSGISWVFVGHPEFERTLESERQKSLHAKILVRARIAPLDERESAQYIEHYFAVAGKNSSDVFTPGALRSICRHAGGIPLNINFLCGNAIWIGYRLSREKINAALVHRASKRMYLSRGPLFSLGPLRVRSFRELSYGVASGLAVVLIGLGVLMRGPEVPRGQEDPAPSRPVVVAAQPAPLPAETKKAATRPAGSTVKATKKLPRSQPKKIPPPMRSAITKNSVAAQPQNRVVDSFAPENASVPLRADFIAQVAEFFPEEIQEKQPSEPKAAATFIQEVPVITNSFAARVIRPGETWKVYLKASTRNASMRNIFTIIEHRGSYQSITEIRKENGRHFAGYLFFNTSPDEASFMFTGFTLKVWIQDKAGRFSDPAVFPVSFQNHIPAERPPKGVFEEQNLGPIMIQLTPVS